MSCEEFLGLDELFDYKNQLMDDILTSEDIIRLLSDDGKTLVPPASLMYTQVFPYEFVPNVTEHAKTYVCCEVDIKEVLTKTFLDPVLYIWVFTHNSKMRLPQGGVRTDKICSEIAKRINGSRMYGLGELDLQSVRRFSPIDNYQGRVMTFSARDFNRLSPSKMPIPGNRKRR